MIRKSVLVLAVLVALLVAAATIVALALRLPAVERALAETVERNAPVRLTGASVIWPFDLAVSRVELLDEGGVWLTLDDVRLSWSPRALLAGQFQVNELSAAALVMARQPVAAPAPDRTNEPPSLPMFPLAVVVERLRLERIELGPAVAGEAVEGRLDAVARLALGRLSLGADLDVGTAAGAGRIRLDASMRGARLDLSAQGRVSALAARPDMAPLSWSMVGGLDLESGAIDIGRARLGLPQGQILAFGRVEGWGDKVALHVSGRLASLSSFAPGLAGRIAFDGDLAGPLAAPRLAATLRADGFSSGVAELDRRLADRVPVRIAAALGADALPAIAFAGLEANDGTFRAGGRLGRAVLAGATLAADAGALSQGRLTGRVALDAGLAGPLSAPVAAVAARANGTVDGRAVEAGLAAAMGDLAGQPRGRIEMRLRASGIEAMAEAGLLWTGRRVEVSDLSVASGADRLTGGLSYDVEAGRGAGRIKGRIAALDRWTALAGLGPVAGRLEVEASLDEGGRARLTAKALSLAGPGFSLKQADLAAELSGLPAAPSGRVRLAGRGLAAGSVEAATIGAEASGTPARLAASASLSGRAAGSPFQAKLSGQGEPDRGRYRLETLEVRLDSQPIRLLAPTDIALSNGRTSLGTTRLALAGGTLEAAGSRAGEAVEARLSLSSLSLAAFSPFLPDTRMTGTLDGTLSLGGTLARPQATARLSGRGLDIGSVPTPFDADLDAAWDGAHLDLNATAKGQKGILLDARARLAMALAEGSLVFPPEPMAASAKGGVDIAKLAELMPMGTRAVAGRLSFAVDAAGTVAAPMLTGEAGVTRGSFRDDEIGLLLRNVEISAQMEGERLSVSGSADDGGRGRLTLNGEGDLAQGPSYRLDANLANLRVAAIDLIHAPASGWVRLAGQGSEAALSGSLVVDGAELDIGAKVPANVVTLEVREVNLPPGRQSPGQAASDGSGPAIRLDLEVALSRLYVRGRGLDSEWRGRLAVAGDTARPGVSGRIDAVRGTFNLFERPLTLAQGQIVFAGEQPVDPALLVVASGPARDVTAKVQVTGRASDPKIAFLSDPPVPQDEVLSRLLFGTEAGRLSLGQKLVLARAAAGQIGGADAAGGSFADPLGFVRKMLGLDSLQAGAADNSFTGGLPGIGGPAGPAGAEAAVTAGQPQALSAAGVAGAALSAGKYLNERTYLRVDQGLTGGHVTLEYDVGGGFSLDTRIGSTDQSGAVGFSWKHDY